jgi:hypothetical protein
MLKTCVTVKSRFDIFLLGFSNFQLLALYRRHHCQEFSFEKKKKYWPRHLLSSSVPSSMGGRMRMAVLFFLSFFLLILVSLEVECYVWIARLELIFYFFLFFHFYVRFNFVRQWKRVVPRTVLMFIDREETHSQLSLLRKQHATDFKWK